MSRICFLSGLVFLLGACALTSKGKPLDVRWYTPELVRPSPVSRPPSGPPLRMGHVRSGIDLEERIASGDGAYAVTFYNDRRWTERPAHYVTNALRRTLFEEHGFQSGTDVSAPNLEVELLSFQEIKTPQAHAGRVALHVRLSTDHVLLEETIAKVEPVMGGHFDDVVAAIARALDAAAEAVAQRVSVALTKT